METHLKCFQGLVSQHASERFVKIKIIKCCTVAVVGDTTEVFLNVMLCMLCNVMSCYVMLCNVM